MKKTKIVIACFITGIFALPAMSMEHQVPQSPYDIAPLFEGSAIGQAVAKTMDGNEIDFTATYANQKTVVIFYRGGWCPYCNKHLNELVDIEGDLKALGYKIVALSPDSPETLSKHYEDGEALYTILSDSEHHVGKAFGIVYHVDGKTNKKLKGYNIDIEAAAGNKKHYLPVPAVFLVDGGKVEFSYVNPDYKTRLSGDVILAAAKFLKNS